MNAPSPKPVAARRPAGTWAVAGMIAMAVALAVFAIWYQRTQTRRCLDFYGSAVARRIQAAPRVELWRLAPGAAVERPGPDARSDISTARGVVHLRRGLVEDANFAWDRPPSPRAGPAVALAFFDAVGDPSPASVIVVRVDADGGSLELAGGKKAVELGRLAAGLRTWLAEHGATGR